MRLSVLLLLAVLPACREEFAAWPEPEEVGTAFGDDFAAAFAAGPDAVPATHVGLAVDPHADPIALD